MSCSSCSSCSTISTISTISTWFDLVLRSRHSTPSWQFAHATIKNEISQPRCSARFHIVRQLPQKLCLCLKFCRLQIYFKSSMTNVYSRKEKKNIMVLTELKQETGHRSQLQRKNHVVIQTLENIREQWKHHHCHCGMLHMSVACCNLLQYSPESCRWPFRKPTQRRKDFPSSGATRATWEKQKTCDGLSSLLTPWCFLPRQENQTTEEIIFKKYIYYLIHICPLLQPPDCDLCSTSQISQMIAMRRCWHFYA